MLTIVTNIFAVFILVFVIASIVVLFKPTLSCNFYRVIYVELFKRKVPYDCSNQITQETESLPDSQVDIAPPQSELAPVKTVINLNGDPYMTRGYWAGGAANTEFKCPKPVPNGFKFVLISYKEKENLGKTRRGTFCEVPVGYCDSHNEFCVNYVFDKACFVNTEWYNWYKKFCIENNLPFNDYALCQE